MTDDVPHLDVASIHLESGSSHDIFITFNMWSFYKSDYNNAN